MKFPSGFESSNNTNIKLAIIKKPEAAIFKTPPH